MWGKTYYCLLLILIIFYIANRLLEVQDDVIKFFDPYWCKWETVFWILLSSKCAFCHCFETNMANTFIKFLFRNGRSNSHYCGHTDNAKRTCVALFILFWLISQHSSAWNWDRVAIRFTNLYMSQTTYHIYFTKLNEQGHMLYIQAESWRLVWVTTNYFYG